MYHSNAVRALGVMGLGLVLLGTQVVGAGLVISEVAWAGTAASAHHEWIEIQNRGDTTVDLLGWELRFAEVRILLGEAGASTVEARRQVLEPGAFLLLERTSDNTVSDIDADLIYRGVLPNTGVQMELVDPTGTVVDSVSPTDAGWPAGEAGRADVPYASMERTPSGDWVSNDGVIRNGLDAKGDPINGTPGRMNSPEVMAAHVPTVRLVAPSEEGKVLSGITIVSWAAQDPDGPDAALSITISVSSDAGTTWTRVAENLVNTGSFSWDTKAIACGDSYRLRIVATDLDSHSGSVISPLFSVENP